MTDPEAPEQNVQDTPAPEDTAPEGTPEDAGSRTETVDWQKRYEDLRPEFDRKAQEAAQAAQYEQYIDSLRNPQTRAEALAVLGIEYVDDEEEDDADYDPYESRLGNIEQFMQDQATRQAQAEEQAYLEQYVEQEFDEIDPDGNLDDEEIGWILRNSPLDENDIPDIKEGKKRLDAFVDSKVQALIKAKKAPQAPSGASPSNLPDLDDPKVRKEWMTQQLAANS